MKPSRALWIVFAGFVAGAACSGLDWYYLPPLDTGMLGGVPWIPRLTIRGIDISDGRGVLGLSACGAALAAALLIRPRLLGRTLAAGLTLGLALGAGGFLGHFFQSTTLGEGETFEPASYGTAAGLAMAFFGSLILLLARRHPHPAAREV